MDEGRICRRLTLFALRITSLSPSNRKKYNVYIKRYVQTSMKETVRLYTSIKEFGPVRACRKALSILTKR
jgi:hypothetical protein